MLNEGIIVNDSKALVKSEIINQIRLLRRANPDELERAVFKALVGHDRDEVDWEIEGNQAGYYTWMRSFDQLIEELIEDGFIIKAGPETLVATEADSDVQYSHLVYPSGGSG